jgi:hypothetical protein
VSEEREAAQELEEKAEELRRAADRLGEMVDGLNIAMGRSILRAWVFAVVNTLILLPLIVLGSYLGLRLALKKDAKGRTRRAW